MPLYLNIVYVPKAKAPTNKTIKFWSIAPPGGGGGGAAADLDVDVGAGGFGPAKTLETFIKVIKNTKKTVFVIFINLNLLNNSKVHY